MQNKKIKISFGIIVLNGEPFTKYCLRSLYPFAHEIVIVEGATENAKQISTKDGHSIDSTLISIRDFIEKEDSEKKVTLITKDGFWKEKDEMSKAYSTKATGNYLWQIDVDEFYLGRDMETIIGILEKEPDIDTISFLTKTFWGGVNYNEKGPIFGDFHRLFKFNSKYEYISHRPPTVVDENKKNLRQKKWIDGYEMLHKYKISLYHYSLVFPFQVSQKTKYYVNIFKRDFEKWEKNNYRELKHPFHINNTFWSISWLKRYNKEHPHQIKLMMEDILKNNFKIELRRTDDIEKLLQSRTYIFLTIILEIFTEKIFVIKRLIKRILYFFKLKDIK